MRAERTEISPIWSFLRSSKRHQVRFECVGFEFDTADLLRILRNGGNERMIRSDKAEAALGDLVDTLLAEVLGRVLQAKRWRVRAHTYARALGDLRPGTSAPAQNTGRW